MNEETFEIEETDFFDQLSKNKKPKVSDVNINKTVKVSSKTMKINKYFK